MDPETVTTEAPAPPPPPEPVAVPEPAKPMEMEEFVHKQYEKHEADLAAAESKMETPPAPEAKAAEAKTDETPKPEPAPAAEVPFTTEQLADPKHWDRLDKAGWERATKLHPVETARVKAGYAAASRIAEDARRAAASRPEPETRVEPKVDPREEARQKFDSLDPAEREEALDALIDLRVQKRFDEIGLDPVETQASAVERAAYRVAVQAMPELATLPNAELDAAVEADPELMDDVALAVTLESEARTRLLAKVMRRAGKIVLETRAATKAAADAETVRKADEAKKAESQKRLQSNANNPSTTVVITPGGKPPKGDKTIEETIHEKVAALR